MAFNKGRSGNPNGGKPGNAGGGRPTDEFKKKMMALSDSPAAWKFRQDVIEGNPIEERTIFDLLGKEIKTHVTPSIENRRRMLADIDDRAHGKAMQMIDTPEGSELARMLIMRPAEPPPVALPHGNGNGHNGNGNGNGAHS